MAIRIAVSEIENLDALLVPHGVVLPSECGVITTAANLREFVRILDQSDKDSPMVVPVIQIEDRYLLDLINKSHSVIPVHIAILADVPGGRYDTMFNNFTYLLPSIQMDELLEATLESAREINTASQALAAGKNVEPDNVDDVYELNKLDKAAAIASKVVSKQQDNFAAPQGENLFTNGYDVEYKRQPAFKSTKSTKKSKFASYEGDDHDSTDE